MRNQRRIWVAIVLGALALGAVFFLGRPRDQYYGGRPLSHWLLLWGEQGKPITQKEEEVLAAIQSDPRAIPYLLKWIEARPPDGPISEGLLIALRRLDISSVNHLEQSWNYRRYLRIRGAVDVLTGMGPQTALAIPELERMLTNTPDYLVREYAALALAQMGAPGRPALTAALTNANPAVRRSIAKCLKYQGTNAYLIIPHLLKTLEDRDWIVAETAWDTLNKLKVDPGMIVPPLIQWLAASNAQKQVWASIRLKSLPAHQATRAAVPALQVAMNSTNNEVRQYATSALRAIVPEVLTNEVPRGVME